MEMLGNFPWFAFWHYFNISKQILETYIFRNPEILDECEIDENTKEVLLENIKRRLTPQSVKIRAGRSTKIYLG